HGKHSSDRMRGANGSESHFPAHHQSSYRMLQNERKRTLWERPCVAKGPQSGPGDICWEAEIWGRYATLSRHKAAPTKKR
ncbi:hypothetical protein, partial [Pseudomonas sp.]|uniref:hypothetical protein n=1 Tax=Pseudomonas sp. TaxID=306 RepID=UPI0028B169A5